MRVSGTVAPMSILVLATALILMTACDHLQAPRFSSPPEQKPIIPLSVKLVFDGSARSAILEQTVCDDSLWKGRLGDAIVQTFTETGRARLTRLRVVDPSGKAQPATAPESEFTAFITLASASFSPTSRHGADNNYLAQFDVRLVATLEDAQGYRFPEAPMVYSNLVSLYTPQMGGSTNQCEAGQLDAAMQTAVDHLASQLMGYLMQLGEKTQGESTAVKQNSGVVPPIAGRGHNPDRYAVIVGLSQYRAPWPGWQNGLSFDTKETVSVFVDSLDVPEGHTLLLQDELATQTDVEAALTLWLPKRVTRDSMVFFYFAGHVLANARTGEIFLMPYDSTLQSSQSRLLSLRLLQSHLLKLETRLVVAIIETPVPLGKTRENNTRRDDVPNWNANRG